MRISDLAERVRVPVSTVRYYERIGLLALPARTSSGYRDYDDESVTRLLFVSRARSLGLSCEQIADLLIAWGGANCANATNRIVRLIDEKQLEIAARIDELTSFAAELNGVRAELGASTPPPACRADLSCCVPARPTSTVLAEIESRRLLPVVEV